MSLPPHFHLPDRAESSAKVIIREMRADDVDPVFALERETPEAPHWPRGDYEAALTARADDAFLTRASLIAEADSCVVGFIVVRELRLPSSQVQFELESIVVAAHFRGSGVGLDLLNAVLSLASSCGADRLELEVRASNHPAVRLYTRAGLAVQGCRPGYYSDPADDALLMAKELKTATT